MANNPFSFSDPDGDDFGLSILIGVGIGILSNGLHNVSNGGSFFDNWGRAAFFGGVSGALGFGIGEIFGHGVGSFGLEVGRAAAHGIVSGGLSYAQGGDFWQGFASGAIGSGVGSGIGAWGKAAGWSRSGTNFAMIGGAGLSGGIGSSISGGSFWKGFGIGATVGAVNHAMGEIMNGGGDPWEVIRREDHELGGFTEYYADGTSAFQSASGAVQFYDKAGEPGMFFPPSGAIRSVFAPWEYVMFGGVLRPSIVYAISNVRFIKNGVLIGSNNYRIQVGKEFISYYPGRVRGTIQGGSKTLHINVGSKHIFLNPLQWGKMTSSWWKPWR